MPYLSSTCQRCTRGMESYAFLRSMDSMKICVLCSLAFSISCLIQSMHPLPLLNPHCTSGRTFSATFCSLFWSVLANTFPATSSKLMPLQLSQDNKSPFFGMGIMRASFHSWGTFCSCHTRLKSFKRYSMRSSPQHFNILDRIPFLPPDMFPIMELSASITLPLLMEADQVL